MARKLKNFKPRIRNSWVNMKTRCNNPKSTRYYLWGGRGISYDPKWETFKGFIEDMGSTYQEGLTLDRIDNNKGYSKENCRWATRKEQSYNRRTNIRFTFKNITQTLTEWAEVLNIKRSTLAQRIYVYKWSIERALTQEVEIHG